MPRLTLLFFLCVLLCAPALAKEKYSVPGPIHLDREAEKWAEKTLRKLSVEEKIGQLFMIWVRAQFMNVNDPQYIQLRDTMNKYHIGSFAMTVRWDPPFLYRNEPYEAAVLLIFLTEVNSGPVVSWATAHDLWSVAQALIPRIIRTAKLARSGGLRACHLTARNAW